jgi:hypothetical protein
VSRDGTGAGAAESECAKLESTAKLEKNLEIHAQSDHHGHFHYWILVQEFEHGCAIYGHITIFCH